MKKIFLCIFPIVFGIYMYMNNIYVCNELTELQMINIEALTSDKESDSNQYKFCYTGTISNATIHQTVPALYCGDCSYHRLLLDSDGRCRLYK